MRAGRAVTRLALGLGMAVLVGLGCRGTGAGRATGMATPSMAVWPTQTGQAVWRRDRGAGEVTGDLLFAHGGGAGALLEFSKPALPLIRVAREGGRWSVHATGRGTREGRGRPPRFSWFAALEFLRGGALPEPWRGGREAATGGWWVENPRTGERIEGFLEGR